MRARQRLGNRTDTFPEETVWFASSTCPAFRCMRVTSAASATVIPKIVHMIACMRFRRAGVYSPGLGMCEF
jgi:hypothetical protein